MKIGHLQWAFFWLAIINSDEPLYWVVWFFTLLMNEQSS